MLSTIKKINPIFVLTAILLLQTYFMIAKGYEKEFFHVDEAFTFMLSNSKYGIDIPDEYKNNWRSGSDYYNLLTTTVDSRFNYKQVYINQTKDVHPPLYYFIIHTITSFFPQQFSKWFGIIPNIFFFVCAQIFVFLLSDSILNSKYKALLPCLLYGFSLGAVSTVEFIRMYGMMTAILMMALYVNCKIIYDPQKLNKYIPSLLIINIAGYLTHYYYIIYSFFLCLFMTAYLYKNNSYKNTLSYIAINISAVIIFILVYPDSLIHIFRGTEGFPNLTSVSLWGRLSAFYEIINKHLFCSFLGMYILCISGYLIIQSLYRKRSKNIQRSFCLTSYRLFSSQFLQTKTSHVILLLAFTTIPSLFIIIKVAAYIEFRYISSLYPSIYILFSYFIFAFSKKHTFIKLASTTVIFAIIYSGISFDHTTRFRDHQKISTIIVGKKDLIVVDFSDYNLMASLLPRTSLYDNVLFITDKNSKNIITTIKQHKTQCNNIGICIVYPHIIHKRKEVEKILNTLQAHYTTTIKQNNYTTCISIIAQKRIPDDAT